MKLVIQIPCFNEADALPVTLRDLPRSLPGIDLIEVIVVDDGSTDATAEVAWACGVAEVVRLGQHRGLARAFMAGIEAGLRRGADLIVNTDADNQYRGDEVGRLVAPLVAGQADMVVGERQGASVSEFSAVKLALLRVGSWVVRRASGTQLPDVASGFRALTREAAMRLMVFSDFTYTLETVIQAGNRGLAVGHVPVETNPSMRPSRLFGSVGEYVLRSSGTILRIYAMYQPLRVFALAGSLIASAGVLLAFRFLYFYVTNGGAGHFQSLIISAICCIVGFQVVLIGLVADLIAGHRRISEEILYRVRRLELERPPHDGP
ncbi:MAG: glycosyltransferase family 2 protein [Candidatus Sericytochromatia bacterium]|nr:glycosyltransferase family 2 protein [Candidatus Sericytochromatia bacterium]